MVVLFGPLGSKVKRIRHGDMHIVKVAVEIERFALIQHDTK